MGAANSDVTFPFRVGDRVRIGGGVGAVPLQFAGMAGEIVQPEDMYGRFGVALDGLPRRYKRCHWFVPEMLQPEPATRGPSEEEP